MSVMSVAKSVSAMRAIALLVCLAATAPMLGCAGTSSDVRMRENAIAPSTKSEADAALLAQWLEGAWSSAEQHARDGARYADIRTSHVRIWKEEPGMRGFWFYAESAAGDTLDRPYRQGVFQLSPQENGAVHAYQFRLRDAQRFAGFLARGEVLPAISNDDLIPMQDCVVIYRPAGPGEFRGRMREKACRNRFRGADYLDASTIVTLDRLVTWDRGMREDGTQVWGPPGGGYEFRRLTPKP
jgi:hypothetical protein